MKKIYAIIFLIKIIYTPLLSQRAYTSFHYEPYYGIRFIDKSEGSGTRTWDFGDGFTKTITGDAHKQSNLSASKSCFFQKVAFFLDFHKKILQKERITKNKF
jgi:hypothetical protein